MGMLARPPSGAAETEARRRGGHAARLPDSPLPPYPPALSLLQAAPNLGGRAHGHLPGPHALVLSQPLLPEGAELPQPRPGPAREPCDRAPQQDHRQLGA